MQNQQVKTRSFFMLKGQGNQHLNTTKDCNSPLPMVRQTQLEVIRS